MSRRPSTHLLFRNCPVLRDRLNPTRITNVKQVLGSRERRVSFRATQCVTCVPVIVGVWRVGRSRPDSELVDRTGPADSLGDALRV